MRILVSPSIPHQRVVIPNELGQSVSRCRRSYPAVANAEVFQNDIRASGHAAVYGILFDTDKAKNRRVKLVKQ